MSEAFDKKLSELKFLVSEKMNFYLKDKKPASLYEPMTYSVSSGGKKLRSVLLLLSCEAVGGTMKDALDAATALELVHNFTLVHDDIMDHDDWRRGRETVYKKWNENVAILSGDGLFALAYLILANTQSPHLPQILTRFSKGILEICEGQALDKEFEERETVSLDEYFEMINKKTARLFAVACEMGAMIGNGSQKQIQSMHMYGEMLGRAFQVQDDLLDIIAEQDVLGKDTGSDLEENKKTFLIAHANQFADKNVLIKLQEIRNRGKLSSSDLKQAYLLFEESGTIAAAKSEIQADLKNAEDALTNIPGCTARDFLYELLLILKDRNS